MRKESINKMWFYLLKALRKVIQNMLRVFLEGLFFCVSSFFSAEKKIASSGKKFDSEAAQINFDSKKRLRHFFQNWNENKNFRRYRLSASKTSKKVTSDVG